MTHVGVTVMYQRCTQWTYDGNNVIKIWTYTLHNIRRRKFYAVAAVLVGIPPEPPFSVPLLRLRVISLNFPEHRRFEQW